MHIQNPNPLPGYAQNQSGIDTDAQFPSTSLRLLNADSKLLYKVRKSRAKKFRGTKKKAECKDGVCKVSPRYCERTSGSANSKLGLCKSKKRTFFSQRLDKLLVNRGFVFRLVEVSV
ncbi:hypothetical protein Rs2_26836 [Raphanus sativus]|nr:hypothetical protein Rs2_26836 [Raphanus sativus]